MYVLLQETEEARCSSVCISELSTNAHYASWQLMVADIHKRDF